MCILVKYLFCVSLISLLITNTTAVVTWDKFMETAQWTTNEFSEVLTPYLVENFPTANVSKQCKSSLTTYATALKNFQPWAVKMFDATGKPTSAILRGTYTDFGLIDDCLKLEVAADSFFKGQFCMLGLTPPLFPLRLGKGEKETYVKAHGLPPKWASKLTQIFKYDWGPLFGLYLGICVPSTCSESDLTNVITAYADPLGIKMSLSDCQVNEPRKWTTIEKISVFFITCLLMMIATGTVLDITERKMKQKSISCNRGGARQKMKAFSLVSNIELLLKQRVNENSIDFLNGMKFWLVIWVLFMHLYAYQSLWDSRRYRMIVNLSQLKKPSLIMLENGLVNTTYFIFLNGFLTSYSLKNKQHSGHKDEKRNKSILRVIFIKYLRVVPTIIFLLLMTFVVPLTYFGPIWNSTWSHMQNKCLKKGWANLLLVSNFLSYNEHCWIHMWVISALMQFSIICLPLLHLAKRHPRLAILAGFLISVACGVRDLLVSVQNEFGFPALFTIGSLELFEDVSREIYFTPYNHFSSFGIGIIFGWVNWKDYKMNKLFLTIGWMIYVVSSVAMYFAVRYPTENIVLIAFHNAFRGTFFSLQTGWLVYNCLNGTAGIIGKIFSWKALQPLGKLLNSVTLYHPLLIITYEATRRERFYCSMLDFGRNTLALIVYSFLFSVVSFLVVESPFSRLCDMLEGKYPASTEKSTNAHSDSNSAIAHSDESIYRSKEKEL